ncbi:MAG: DNA polymerase II large subunit [Candidatus Woesearchaeota archaeon]
MPEDKREASEDMENYFEILSSQVEKEKVIAQAARKKGYDPEKDIEIKLAKNMAERVVGLISTVAPQLVDSNAVSRIIELEKEYGAQNWRVALKIAEEIAKERFCKFPNKKEAMEVGIRMGFAYVTVGVVSSPLEGFTEIILKKRNDDGKEYFCLNFSGPIRNAGGTAASVAVLIADFVRKKMGYAQWDPTEDEIRRGYTEVYDYHERVTNLQYKPSRNEMEFLIKNMPLEISGDPTEEIEVSNYKDLPRTKTNRIRGGMCLIYSSCIPLKAPKIWKQLSKWGHEMDLEQWDFLEEFVHIQKEMKAKGKTTSNENDGQKIKPDFTYIADLVAGRPVFGHPLRSGGFRLRYGRTRLSGYSAQAMHPATMHVMNDFIAIGTQLKVERPGKAAAYTPCDSLEGPIVRLKDGSVVKLQSEKKAVEYKNDIEKIIYNGDILINYGDFFNRAHILAPPGYCEEWWALELEKKIVDMFGSLDFDKVSEFIDIPSEDIERIVRNPLRYKPSVYFAYNISSKLEVPLHPKYTLFWKLITRDQLLRFFDWIFKAKVIKENNRISRIVLLMKEDKEILEKLGLEHKVLNNEYVIIERDFAYLFIRMFSMAKSKLSDIIRIMNENQDDDSLELVNKISTLKMRDKAGIFVGSRMGRPEKAKMRKLTGSPHVLFPVGEQGGKYRSFQGALQQGFIEAEFPIYKCPSTGKDSVFSISEDTDEPTIQHYISKNGNLVKAEDAKKDPEKYKDYFKYSKQKININDIFRKFLSKLDTKIYPDLIKGVRGTVNKEHIPEHLIKGILRAKHNIYVNKDGTVRYDCSEVPITHFKPGEVGASVDKLRAMGYTKDINGTELTNPDQVVEIKPQDIVLPACVEALEEPSDDVLFRVTKFIDELFMGLYGMEPYYNCKSKEDLIGQLVIGLAPHTSAGILCRIVGFSKSQGFFAHPMIHAAMRRDTDGDESCFFLLMDGFLNFSKRYLPSSRGSTMDAPLVLTTKLLPAEVDDMVFDMEMVWRYPLEFYEACLEYKMPWDVKMKQLNDCLNTPCQYEGFGFTHSVSDMNKGVKCSAYKTLPSMEDKLKSQMDLAVKLSSVDESDVARLVIEKHFMKDLKGNLRKFSQQQFRCVHCNEKYRRPPLLGKCPACGGKIIFTISEGSVGKYLEPSISLAKNYHVDSYLSQTIDLTRRRFEDVFGREKEKQSSLGAWFG